MAGVIAIVLSLVALFAAWLLELRRLDQRIEIDKVLILMEDRIQALERLADPDALLRAKRLIDHANAAEAAVHEWP